MYAVTNVKYQKKCLLCFIMVLLMILILLLKSWLKNFKANLSVWVKIQKNILHLVFLLKRREMMVKTALRLSLHHCLALLIVHQMSDIILNVKIVTHFLIT